MRTSRPWIAVYLVLSLALASLAGFSPFWHQLIEHGGKGPWHTHNGYAEPALLRISDAGTVLLVKRSPVQHADTEVTSKLKSHGDFKLPLKSLGAAVHKLVQWLGPVGTKEQKSAPQHEHHSLAQLLASGLLEQAMDIPLILHFSPPFTYRCFGNDALLLDSNWDLQSAGRAPPASLS